MKRVASFSLIAFGLLVLATGALSAGCGEPGKEGTQPVDCGAHGTEHDGHCHCDSGYLFGGSACVTPEEITEVCAEEAEADAGEHHHGACVCPATGVCPCDHGTVQTFGTRGYCVPELHHDD